MGAAGLLSLSAALALGWSSLGPVSAKTVPNVAPTEINRCLWSVAPNALCSYSISPAIAAPTAFGNVTDAQQCGAHGYAALAVEACAAAINAGEVVVAWSWNATACQAAPACTTSIDGFRVYRFAGKSEDSAVPVTTQYSGARVTLVSFPDPGGTCFVVRAYKGRLESADSNEYCPAR